MQFLKLFDDDSLARVQKCAQQFSTALRTFSKVVADVRKIVKTEGKTEENKEKTEENKEKTEQNEEKTEQNEEKTEQNEEIPLTEWVFSPSGGWKITHNQELAEFLLTKYRGDVYKNIWRLVSGNPNDRQNWEKVPRKQFNTLYNYYTTTLIGIRGTVKSAKTNNSALWQNIRKSKQSREHFLHRSPIKKHEFRDILISNHESLTPLRGKRNKPDAERIKRTV